MEQPGVQLSMQTGFFPDVPDDGVPKAVSADFSQNIVSHIESGFQTAKRNRENNGVDAGFIKSLHQVRGEYTPEEEALIRQSGAPLAYIPLTDTKVRGLMSRLGEIVFTDSTMEMRPSPIPELAPDVVQSITAAAMEDLGKMGMLLLEQNGMLEQIPLEARVAASMEAALSVVSPRQIEVYAASLRTRLELSLKQDAEDKAKRMDLTIKDQLGAGSWREGFTGAVENMITYGTGFMHGPTPRVERRLKWRKSRGRTIPSMEPRIILGWESTSPWDVYPQPGVTDIQKGDLFIRVRFLPESLRTFASEDIPGYIAKNIDAVLAIGEPKDGDDKEVRSDSTLETPFDRARETLTKQAPFDGTGNRELSGVEYWGDMPGGMLKAIGLESTPDGEMLDPTSWHAVNAIVVNSRLIYCRILAAGESRPYSKACCYVVPDSFWGVGIPEKMRVSQAMVNTACRNLAVNMAQSAGPQIVIDDVNRIDPRCSLVMRAWKAWLFRSQAGSSGNRPMSFFQPSDNAASLVAVIDRFSKQADEDTGVPGVVYGNSSLTGAAARTSSGLSMVLEGVERGIKEITRRVDSGFMTPGMMRMYEFNMLHNPDEGIKCDAYPEVKGVLAVVLKQQVAGRYFELLNAIKGDPILIQIVGAKGVSNLLRRAIDSALDIDSSEIMPSRSQEEWNEIEKGIAAQMQTTQSQRDGATAQTQAPTSAQAVSDARQQPQQQLQQPEPQQPQGGATMVAA